MKVSHDFEPWYGYWGSLFALRRDVVTVVNVFIRNAVLVPIPQ
jgi:hypothetical protein